MKLRPALPQDFPDILALNSESVHFLSPMTAARLEELHSKSELHRILEKDGVVVAFLLTFRERADYDSVNYQWFTKNFDRFLYVDRIVVSQKYRGIGAGRILYGEVFAHARATNVSLVTCEYDVEPPNAASEHFHAQFGFAEVGRQRVAGGSKLVSLQAANVQAE